jgi:hypothetical protein
VRAKVDDYFARCRLAAFDARAAAALNAAEADFVALGPKTLTADAEEIAKLPLAPVVANRPLPLAEGLNPAWAARIATLAEATVGPILGGNKPALSEGDWNTLKERMAPFVTWQAAKPTTAISTLSPARLREMLAGSLRQDLTALVAKDASGVDQNQQVEQVEKMIRVHRDLVRLLHNFVTFSEFYRTRRSIFQVGTLFIDGRSCDLCLPVEDTGKHASLAGLARAYLLYCDCTRKSGEKRSIVAAVTGGNTDNLMVGRNGVFVDHKGNDWDATVTRIVENPIGIRQAFWSPYKSFVRMVEEQVAKRASAADQEARQKVKASAEKTAHADKGGPEARRRSRSPRRSTSAPWPPSAWPWAESPRSCRASWPCSFGLGVWMPHRSPRASPGHLGAIHADRVAEAAPAQRGPDSRRQRLVGERHGQNQRALRGRADPGGRASPRFAPPVTRSLRRETPPVETLPAAAGRAGTGFAVVFGPPRSVPARGHPGAEYSWLRYPRPIPHARATRSGGSRGEDAAGLPRRQVAAWRTRTPECDVNNMRFPC